MTGRLSVDAYPLTSAPEALTTPGDPEKPPTEVTDGAADSDARAGPGADGPRGPLSGGDRDGNTSVSFCPSCGSDLTAYDEPNFCPECGDTLPG